jgi:hypothetical protein
MKVQRAYPVRIATGMAAFPMCIEPLDVDAAGCSVLRVRQKHLAGRWMLMRQFSPNGDGNA